ncbi:uncharacterized protein B0H18DRAFT_998868 [Fomitopsis serialis]|uniref:uncharacterized protein n=1 Tax=Fomitopsis serialis TaxID=139415 RepID=UPI002007A321|nr:uncharacterized protein B0H18DRAFT_998868 [Neoantrodia serialis]KAH9928823.1 hypothetical protein B0H18DRAFT_998868 [Neoantrodia serialis]
MDSSSSPDIESTPPPAVSSLRSRFEQLAAGSSAAPGHKRPLSSHGLLTPEPSSPRPRAASGTDELRPDARLLRPTSSSSDLKTGTKRPPPPPPGRSSRAPSPAPLVSSPLLRPTLAAEPPSSPLVHDATLPSSRSVSPNKTASLSRKPPPPPPPHVREPPSEATPAERTWGILFRGMWSCGKSISGKLLCGTGGVGAHAR